MKRHSVNSIPTSALIAIAFALGNAGARPAQAWVAPDRATEEDAASSTATTALSRLPIIRRTLDNGLRLVLSPERSIPTVAIAVFYDVGSRNEVRGRSGFAHLFEHMMFQGSDNVGKGEHFTLILNRGGSMNGTTSHDRTNYFETLPSNELGLGLWLEADRMRSLAITQENFENQRQVVMEERRQSYDNQPYAPAFLRINELAYGNYWPYAHSTIGDMQDLQKAPLQAVRAFWKQYYGPANAVLAIAGDFDPEQAFALVKHYFGTIDDRSKPRPVPSEIKPQTSERSDTLIDANAELPAFHLAWHVPPARHEDHYALEILASVLGDGESSRLYQLLVKDKELLQEIYLGTDDRRGPDLFSVWAVVSRQGSAAKAKELIFQSLEDVAEKGISARELERAKNQIRSRVVFGLQSSLHRASKLAEYELFFGDANIIRDELERYLSVSEADVRRVAGAYFPATNRTVLDVVPAPKDSTNAKDTR